MSNEANSSLGSAGNSPGRDIQPDTGGKKPKKKKNPKRRIAIAVIVVVAVVAVGVGFWTWHEQPSFCGAICHTPMDKYYETYQATPGQPTTDKYGNTVSNSDSMLVVVHREQGLNCLSCHIPTISEQVNEATGWLTGNYIFPLKERNLTDLMAYHGATTAEASKAFCINDSCHSDLADPLTFASVNRNLLPRNPHSPPNDLIHNGLQLTCSDCHKSHRASTNYCTQCHADAPLPDGWVKYSDAMKIQQ